jgi:hypothetical protein
VGARRGQPPVSVAEDDHESGDEDGRGRSAIDEDGEAESDLLQADYAAHAGRAIKRA